MRFVLLVVSALVLSALLIFWTQHATRPNKNNVVLEGDASSCEWMSRAEFGDRTWLTVHRACLKRAFGPKTIVTLEE